MRKILATVIFAASAFATISANAVTLGTSAAVTIVEPLTITQLTQMSFGKVVKPSLDSVISLTNAGVTSVASGDALIIGGGAAAGSFTIAGSADSADTISITLTDTSAVPGLTLSNFEPKYNNAVFTNGATGLAAPGVGKNLLVGANLNIIAANVTAGVKNLSYNVVVVYQ